MIKAKEITRIARSFIGTPYRHQGRSRMAVDCWGLLFAVGTEAGVIPAGLVSPANYGRLSNIQMRAKVAEWCTETDQVDDGILVLIKWPGTNYAGHMGILTHEGNMIHAYSMENKVVEHGFRGPWVKLADSKWALPNVEYTNG